MSKYRTRSLGSGVISICFAGAHASAQSFSGLGHVAGGVRSQAIAASRDCSVVIGTDEVYVGSTGYYRPIRWTAAGGMRPMLPSLLTGANGISGDGAYAFSSIAQGERGIACMYDATGEAVVLGSMPSGGDSIATCGSFAGEVVAGRGTSVAHPLGESFAWRAASGVVPIGVLPGDSWSWARAVSDDGSTVVGMSGSGLAGTIYSTAYRWTRTEGMRSLGTLSGAPYSFPAAVSANGAVIVGSSGDPGSFQAFRWTSAAMQDIHSPLASSSRAQAVSGDGSMVGGWGALHRETVDHAWIWTQALGMVDLNAYLPFIGVDLHGWELTQVVAIDTDGRTLVGTGLNPVGLAGDSYNEAWIATLPPTLPSCLTVAAPVVTPTCPSGHASVTVETGGLAPVSVAWQLRNSVGVWQTLGPRSPDSCEFGYPEVAYVVNPSATSAEIVVQPCVGSGVYAVRALASNGCMERAGPESEFVVCRADANCDQRVDVLDVFAFVDQWLALDPRATFPGYASGDIANLFTFLTAWFAGC